MRTQKPAEGISRGKTWPDAHTYKVECDCGDSDHAIDAWVEIDGGKDIPDVTVSFYIKSCLPVWDKKFSRIRTAISVLFGGTAEREHHIIMNQQVATNFLSALDCSIKELEAKTRTSSNEKSSTSDQV